MHPVMGTANLGTLLKTWPSYMGYMDYVRSSTCINYFMLMPDKNTSFRTHDNINYAQSVCQQGQHRHSSGVSHTQFLTSRCQHCMLGASLKSTLRLYVGIIRRTVHKKLL